MENLSLFCQWFMFIYYFILELIAKGGKDAEDIKEIVSDMNIKLSDMEKDIRDGLKYLIRQTNEIPGQLVVFSWFLFCFEYVDECRHLMLPMLMESEDYLLCCFS